MNPAPHVAARRRSLLTAASAAIGGAIAWWHWRGPWLAALASLTASLLIIAVLLPRVYEPVFAVLDRLIRTLLQGFTWLILGCLFLFVFVPGRLVLALRRQDPIARRPDPTRPTYWHNIARTTRDTAAQARSPY